MSPRLALLTTLVLLLGPATPAPQTFSTSLFEGTRGPTLLVDCKFSWRNDVTLKFDPTQGDFKAGTKLTGYEAINLQTTNKAVVAKSRGGIGTDVVWFYMKEANNNGIYFQFKLWGTVPLGANPSVRTGAC